MEGGSKDDDLDSVNRLFHWQMEDYELFQSCNILTIEEERNRDGFPKEFREIKEGNAQLDETPTHVFNKEKPIKYEDATVQTMNLRDDTEPKNILVGDNWNPVLKTTALKIVQPFRRAKQVHRIEKRQKEFWPYGHVWRRVKGSTFAINRAIRPIRTVNKNGRQ